MSIEKLSAAAQAAGFAMATSEDLLTSTPRHQASEANPWQSALISQSTAPDGEGAAVILRRNLYSLLGWRATA